MKREYFLEPMNENVKSYYKKAIVTVLNEDNEEEDTILQLTSYSTKVAQINVTQGTCEVYGTYSMTTIRHIKEFLRQNGYWVDSKKEIEKDYLIAS